MNIYIIENYNILSAFEKNTLKIRIQFQEMFKIFFYYINKLLYYHKYIFEIYLKIS